MIRAGNGPFIPSAERWTFSCLGIRCIFLFILSAKTFSVYHSGTRREDKFTSRMGEIGIRELDE